MLKVIITLGLMSFTNSALAEEFENAYQACHAKVTNAGYGSGNWERTCSENYDMPKPLMIKCARFVKNGFPKNDNDLDLKVCKMLCESNENWGPWYDYELPNDLKEIVLELKRRHNNGKCQAD